MFVVQEFLIDTKQGPPRDQFEPVYKTKLHYASFDVQATDVYEHYIYYRIGTATLVTHDI